MTLRDRNLALVLPAPAKINLFLHVTGRRADGYHLLETVFQFVDLADTITLMRRGDGQIRRCGGWAEVAAEDDLAVRAAHILKAACRCPLGVDITVEKRIPTGAGLGGGSSDAATVLLGLNQLWDLALDRSALQALGARLGADVPVFVYGRNAYATGIGDALEPVPIPALWYVLVMPPTAVATASVFSAAELTRDTIPVTLSGFSEQLARNDLPGRNDLEPVVLARNRMVAAALVRLRDACSTVLGDTVVRRARLTGSGACVFAAATSQVQAQAIAAAFTASAMSDAGRWASNNQIKEPGSRGSDIGLTADSVWVVAGLTEHPLGSRQVG